MPRYAVYFVPAQETDLAGFGSRAIGYDVNTGTDCAYHDHDFYRQPDIRSWTESPSRYGFHATLKAPFELKEGYALDDLLSAAHEFTRNRPSVPLGRLQVSSIGRFVALTIRGNSDPVDQLAGACVREFEDFRAPLSAADRERRLAPNLSDRQAAYVDQWGYPYVFEEFRFHMTLTGALPDRQQVECAKSALSEIYTAIDAPVAISSITIAEQPDRNAKFRVLERFSLKSQ